jgi:hypothetical protein
VTALSGLAVSPKGTTSQKGCPNNAIIMGNLLDRFIKQVKNGRHKKTDLIIGVLSPFGNEPLNPTSMFRGADRLAVLLSCVNFFIV